MSRGKRASGKSDCERLPPLKVIRNIKGLAITLSEFEVDIASFKDATARQAGTVAKWLSCNGEPWGMGPTAVFASAAALYLYSELRGTISTPASGLRPTALENMLISTMVLGMLALMVHLWVCSMRFFLYYLDTLVKDTPGVLLELTTVGLLGQKSELVPLGPLTRFLRQQQPQIHITVCWFLALCYADYVRKHCCRRFSVPYLEQWQAELQAYAARGVNCTVKRIQSFVASVQQRLRTYEASLPPDGNINQTDSRVSRRPASSVDVRMADTLTSQGRDACCGRASDSVLVCRKRSAAHLGCHVLSLASDNTAEAIEKLRSFINILEWARCGDDHLSAVPTLLWAVGATAFAHRLLDAMFRRFLFRRVPLWEQIFQHLLFVWMVLYSLHFWHALVRGLKLFVEYYDDDGEIILDEENLAGTYVMQQCVIWLCGATPLAVYVYTRQRSSDPPLMIWITTNPWQRREMGPYGYYLNRPFSTIQSFNDLSLQKRTLLMRRAQSDTKITFKEPPRKRRNSKSV